MHKTYMLSIFGGSCVGLLHHCRRMLCGDADKCLWQRWSILRFLFCVFLILGFGQFC